MTYKTYIKIQPCLICKKPPPSILHHVRRASNSGVGMKPNDKFGIPLCHTCHSNLHQFGEKTFVERWAKPGMDLMKATEKLNIEYR